MFRQCLWLTKRTRSINSWLYRNVLIVLHFGLLHRFYRPYNIKSHCRYNTVQSAAAHSVTAREAAHSRASSRLNLVLDLVKSRLATRTVGPCRWWASRPACSLTQKCVLIVFCPSLRISCKCCLYTFVYIFSFLVKPHYLSLSVTNLPIIALCLGENVSGLTSVSELPST